jgi:hypothetical protein
MDEKANATRRRFFWQAGAALSAPLAVATARASQPSAEARAALEARLAALEDRDAIRALNRAYARHLNAGARDELTKLFVEPSRAQSEPGVRKLSADMLGEHAVIEVASDRGSATARTPCTIEIETPIEPGSTLVAMAQQQGEGILRRSEPRMLENDFVRRDGRWMIARSTLRPV